MIYNSKLLLLYKKLSSIFTRLTFKLFLIFILLITVPVVAFAVTSFYLSSSSIEKDFIAYKANLSTQLIKNIEENIDGLKKQTAAIYLNQDSISYFINHSLSNIDDEFLKEKKLTENLLMSIIQSNGSTDYIALINTNGELVEYMDRWLNSSNLISVKNEAWFKKVLTLYGSPLIIDPQENKFIFRGNRTDKDKYISIARALNTAGNNSTPYGVILFGQKINTLDEILSKYISVENEMFLVISNNNSILYKKNELLPSISQYIIANTPFERVSSFKFTFKGNKMLATSNKSVDLGWKIISVIPVNELHKKSAFLKNTTILLLIVLIIIIFLISIVVSNMVAFPLKRITQALKKFETGDFTTRVPVKGHNELSEISHSFNSMVSNIKTLIDDKFEANLLRKQAELESLQSQVNPHFLFNTLNSIKTVSDKTENFQTSLMVQNLSDIFRYSLNRGVYIVKLSDEFENVKKYLYLQECRFVNKYEVEYDIDEDVYDFEILRFTLQPIVENALYHGLELKPGKGKLSIVAKEIGNNFIIYISDNGKGLPLDELEKINKILDSPFEEQNKLMQGKIGIYNVNARIKYHFGNDYGLKIFSTPDNNTTVKITLPINKSEGIQS